MRLIEQTPKKWKKFVRSRSPITESIVPLTSKATRKKWSAMSDKWLSSYAKWFIDENGIENRNGLEKADKGLYQNLRKRKLLDNINFKADQRAWSKYSNDDLVAHAQNHIDENGIKSRKRLANADRGLYSVLSRRKLLDKIKLKSSRRVWSKYSNDDLVAHAQNHIENNG